ncbi:MAG: hypothetical protein B7733_22070 [Myxococcales bacterium FL481]|nr:MAG: hypothetical protein B7733_22070 [Myxococcales bacterium FL481]
MSSRAAEREPPADLLASLGAIDVEDPHLIALDGDDASFGPPTGAGVDSRDNEPPPHATADRASRFREPAEPHLVELDDDEAVDSDASPALSLSALPPSPGVAADRQAAVCPSQPAPPNGSAAHERWGGRRGPCFDDVIASRITGLALGLALALAPAALTTYALADADLEPRLAELKDAIDRPLAVRAGRVRAPQVIAAEIHNAERRVVRRFWLTWLIVGLPLGAALAVVRRPASPRGRVTEAISA